jgi:membrane-associated phospholipid phosphatase
MKRSLIALAGVALTLTATAAVFVYQHATGGATVAAAGPAGSGSGAIVVDWNKELVKIVNTPGAQPATIHPTRSFAILHVAIYDAVVSINERSEPYLFSLNAPAGARPDAAAAQAGHDVLLVLYPSWNVSLDQQLAAELAAIPDGTAKLRGIAVGHLSATLSLASRANDGSNVTPPAIPAGTQPGRYRPAPPAFTPPVFTQWPQVNPFVLRSADQFRPAAPPPVTSTAYAQALGEVKSLGEKTSTSRSADQTVIAKFWPGPIWVTWNEIAENSALAHHADLARTAQLFALLNLSFADTTIAFYDAKYQYLVWRPITGIREGGAGTPAMAGDPTWTPLLGTAPDPSYPGAHSAISAAGAAVIAKFFGDRDQISVTSDVLPGVVRNFDSYSAAATEAGLSRIYGGVHTRIDHVAGLKLGIDVAGFVLAESHSSGFGFIGT